MHLTLLINLNVQFLNNVVLYPTVRLCYVGVVTPHDFECRPTNQSYRVLVVYMVFIHLLFHIQTKKKFLRTYQDTLSYNTSPSSHCRQYTEFAR